MLHEDILHKAFDTLARMSTLKKVGGVLLIIIGFLALVTPLTPGAWLIFVGLELIGIRLAAWDKIKAWLANRRTIHRGVTEDTNTKND